MKKGIISNKLSSIFISIIFLSAVSTFQSCKSEGTENKKVEEKNIRKIGVLLVNHGSRSETWRNSLLQLEKNVADSILKSNEVKGIKTAHMEYTEPSIATRLKEFDKDGFTDIIIIPIFLTVSPHSFEDIPTIIGQKEDPQSMEMLKIEKIERYTPKAKTYLTPLLDFTDILQKNVLRRTEALSQNPEKEGLVLIGYGDETYDKEWGELFNKVAEYVKQKRGITEHTYGWCGHIAHYNPDETTKAINNVLKKKEKAVVIPVLVAHDENFQIKIIGGGIEKVKNYKEKVIYKPDAILPDANIEKWVINITKEYVSKVQTNEIN
ncbi:MAG: CbiX/SirB N-terminal domain-containing protein [Vicingaceae bacterium]|nr:MAG: CbiX/SirB N-terminal domain-containing protein [Vicingaceae bacterium]